MLHSFGIISLTHTENYITIIISIISHVSYPNFFININGGGHGENKISKQLKQTQGGAGCYQPEWTIAALVLSSLQLLFCLRLLDQKPVSSILYSTIIEGKFRQQNFLFLLLDSSYQIRFLVSSSHELNLVPTKISWYFGERIFNEQGG